MATTRLSQLKFSPFALAVVLWCGRLQFGIMVRKPVEMLICH